MALAWRPQLFRLDRWHPWRRLRRYRTWPGPDGETRDGTTNAGERAMGWGVKERYRSMRGDKRPQSVLHVSRRIAAMGTARDGPGFALAAVLAWRGGGQGGQSATIALNQSLNSHGLEGISKIQVDRLCAELDAEVERFRTRPLPAVSPCLWLDAAFVKVRDEGRVGSQAVVIAGGVSGDGTRDVPGVEIGPSADGAFWLRLCAPWWRGD